MRPRRRHHPGRPRGRGAPPPTPRLPTAPAADLPAEVERRARSCPHQPAQLGEPSLTDALDLAQLIDGGEAAVPRAPLHDALRRHRADPGQPVELLDGGRVQVEHAAGPGDAPSAGPGGAACGPASGAGGTPTATCSPSLTRRARFTGESVPGSAPPAASRTSATRAPAATRTSPGRRPGRRPPRPTAPAASGSRSARGRSPAPVIARWCSPAAAAPPPVRAGAPPATPPPPRGPRRPLPPAATPWRPAARVSRAPCQAAGSHRPARAASEPRRAGPPRRGVASASTAGGSRSGHPGSAGYESSTAASRPDPV